MLLTAQRPITNGYRIEAPGWNSTQSFFVEKCELEWKKRPASTWHSAVRCAQER
jgi:hypothetical protein